MLQKLIFYILNTHCQSCKTLIEEELKNEKGIMNIQFDLKTEKCELEYEDAQISKERIFAKIEKLNYQACETKPVSKNSKSKNFVYAFFALILFIAAYSLVKYFGLFEILGKLNEQNVSLSLIFLIGLLASFHCIGMCGGLVVTYSTKLKENDKKYAPHLQYNLGRFISYTIIGGILGGVGSFFGINPAFTAFITILAGVFMMIMGLSLLTQFKFLDKIKIRTPDFLAKFIFHQKSKGPFIIGLLNGLMPCGPLQAMQMYALASGSIVYGTLSMGIYALGTIPMMFIFGSIVSQISMQKTKMILKISGIVVIILGIFMLNRGLTAYGLGFAGFSRSKNISVPEFQVDGTAQTIYMDLTFSGYEPNVLYIKKGIPVRWVINVKEMSGCTNEIVLHGYDISKKLSFGENVIEFTPKDLGEIKFSCGMNMVWGKFIVTENGQSSNSNANTAVANFSESKTCKMSAGSCGCSTN